MPPPHPPPSAPPDSGTSHIHLLQRAGSLVTAAVVASCFAGVPAAVRIATKLDGALALGPVGIGLAVAAAWALPMLVAVGVLRHARVGVRAFEGDGHGRRTTALAVWTAAFGVFLAIFGTALRGSTHHHALAGATFALVSVVVGGVLGIIALRFARTLFESSDAVRAGGITLVVAAALLAVALLAVRLAHVAGAEGAHDTAELLIDGLAFAITAILASRPELIRSRAVAISGVPIALVLLVGGVYQLRAAPALAASLRENAPASTPIVKLYTEH